MEKRVDPKRTVDDLAGQLYIGFDLRRGKRYLSEGRRHPRSCVDDTAFLFDTTDQEEEEFEDPDEWLLGHL